MTTDEIIKKLGIKPSYEDWDWELDSPLYTHSDLDRIVTELSAEINRLNIENQTMYDTEGKQFALMKEGYEAQLGECRKALKNLIETCPKDIDCHHMNHPKKFQHKADENCPVVDAYVEAIDAAIKESVK